MTIAVAMPATMAMAKAVAALPSVLAIAPFSEPDASSETRSITMRSEEHTSELQSLMRISYAVFCLKKKKNDRVNTQQEVKQTKVKNTKTNKNSHIIHITTKK